MRRHPESKAYRQFSNPFLAPGAPFHARLTCTDVASSPEWSEGGLSGITGMQGKLGMGGKEPGRKVTSSKKAGKMNREWNSEPRIGKLAMQVPDTAPLADGPAQSSLMTTTR
jgi:hypothetical protein